MKETILVTGFGLFGEYKINASWEAVKLLKMESFPNYKLIVEEIPVVYSQVEKLIPLLWTKYNPKLVVHVGVSSSARKITIETDAVRCGYVKKDADGNVHPTGEICVPVGSQVQSVIGTSLNVEQMCAKINDRSEAIKFRCSNNAGRYLCEFMYYTSLLQDCKRTLFVHVPELNNPYSAEELADGITSIILCALEMLTSCDNSSCSVVNV